MPDQVWMKTPTKGTYPDPISSSEHTQASHGSHKASAPSNPQQPQQYLSDRSKASIDGQPPIIQVVNVPVFDLHPVHMKCPHCQNLINTTTESEPGAKAWVLSLVLCAIGCWICSCIPCCISSLKSVTHKCPNCKKYLGRFKGEL